MIDANQPRCTDRECGADGELPATGHCREVGSGRISIGVVDRPGKGSSGCDENHDQQPANGPSVDHMSALAKSTTEESPEQYEGERRRPEEVELLLDRQ